LINFTNQLKIIKMNASEKEFKNSLKKLKKEGVKYIALSLHPAIGLTIIERSAINRAFINEGRLGNFDNISESFYDSMVEKYDRRKF